MPIHVQRRREPGRTPPKIPKCSRARLACSFGGRLVLSQSRLNCSASCLPAWRESGIEAGSARSATAVIGFDQGPLSLSPSSGGMAFIRITGGFRLRLKIS